MASTSDVKEFYDEFANYEVNRGINLRHYHIFNEVIKAGLRNNHQVLEIGCGTGELSFLLHRFLRRGHLVSTDISPNSIALAEKRIGASSRMQFIVTDMTDFTYPDKFDFIVLPDVLEHIPIDNHPALFGSLRTLMLDHSKIIIHIPHPKLIESDSIHKPEILQIIDQPISAVTLLQDCYPHGLMLDQYDSYSLFHDTPDYIFITLKRDILPIYVDYPKIKIILKKFRERILCLIRTWL